VVEIHTFRIVDDVMDNLDRRMVEVHVGKIAAARSICETLYAGFETHKITEEAAAEAVAKPDSRPIDISEDPTEVAAV
jgi:hypothetical protein